MIDYEDIKLYLPKYLSAESERVLFEDLKRFNKNIDTTRIYSSRALDEDIIYQGDGLEGMLLINLPNSRIYHGNAIVLSNTCDIDINNTRMFPSSICYAPIFNLEKYLKLLKSQKGASLEKISQFTETLKKQRITQILYLPKCGKLESDSIVALDKINNCENKIIEREEINKIRLFSLSNFGLYLFLFKLSIHFSRMREKVDRG